jgi:NitT/TauT family transport system ATP-binding protein
MPDAAATAPPLLKVDGVTLQYKTTEHLVTATYRVGFEVHRGDRFVLLGPSGCGKSTLLKGVAGFMSPVEGTMTLNGRTIDRPGPDRMMVFQEFDQLLPWKTVLQNVMFPMECAGKWRGAEAAARARHFIEKVNLTKFTDVYPHMLSGGMKQRVAIARVLANDAELVLMDEPFGALDAMTRERLQDELLDIWQRTGLTVVFVTHAIEEAIFLADRVVVMTPGPGRIESDNRLELVRPRDVASPEFNDIRRVLGAKLHSHHGKKAA